MKILNLYAGIGGNRKLWGNDHEITAVELDKNIAKIYQDFFPNDKVVVADAHKYLETYFNEFDFIWSSPPCPSHSRIRNEAGVGSRKANAIFPDMKLYEEIIFLQHQSKLKNSFKGKYCIENVISYYKPLIPPQEIAFHYFWANFYIRPFKIKTRGHFLKKDELKKLKRFDVDNIKALKNCVEPETGLHVFNEAFKSNQKSLF